MSLASHDAYSVVPACAHRLSTLRLMCFLPVSSASTPLSVGDAAARQRSVFFPTMQRYEKILKLPNRPVGRFIYPPQRSFCHRPFCPFRCLFENNIIIYYIIYYYIIFYFLFLVYIPRVFSLFLYLVLSFLAYFR